MDGIKKPGNDVPAVYGSVAAPQIFLSISVLTQAKDNSQASLLPKVVIFQWFQYPVFPDYAGDVSQSDFGTKLVPSFVLQIFTVPPATVSFQQPLSLSTTFINPPPARGLIPLKYPEPAPSSVPIFP